jgi:hypothetical protein
MLKVSLKETQNPESLSEYANLGAHLNVGFNAEH